LRQSIQQLLALSSRYSRELLRGALLTINGIAAGKYGLRRELGGAKYEQPV